MSVSGDRGGAFILQKDGRELLHTDLKDLDASVSIVWNRESDHFAITWSDGGAIGNFRVRVFAVRGSGVDELAGARAAELAFRQRHFCRARGNNTQAYTWVGRDELAVVTSVYPTGDCGPDLGYTEAYIVRAADGSIVEHMSLRTFKRFARAHPE